MPVLNNAQPGIPLRIVFGAGDILTVLTGPTPNGNAVDSLALLEDDRQREIGSYHDLGRRELDVNDRCVALLTFQNRESLRVVIEQLQDLEERMRDVQVRNV